MNPPDSCDWLCSWQQILGFPSDLPGPLVAIFVFSFAFVFVVVPSCLLIQFLERKLGADFQARVGPNRAGPAGVLQSLADFLKLLQKEGDRVLSLNSKAGRGQAFWLAVWGMALYSTLAALPFGSTVLLVDSEMSAFLPLFALLVLALANFLLGLSQGTLPASLGGVRGAAQTLSGAFPALLAVLAVGIRAGGFRWSALANVQEFAPWKWTAFSSPFQFVAFIVFEASGLVALGVPPFDGVFAMGEIRGGVTSGLVGRKYGFVRFGRTYGFFLWSLLCAVLFLGGWRLPQPVQELLGNQPRIRLLFELSVVLLKTWFLMILIIWLARSNPRVRADQTTDLVWKVFSPIALVALVGVALWTAWGGR